MQKKSIFILILLTVFYWSSRVVYFDSDTPKWKTFYYSQADELSYTIGAFNLVYPPPGGDHYSCYARRDYLPTTLFEDLIIATSLTVFGNNYFGLRFPFMLAGYCSLILIFLLFEKRFGIKAAVFASALFLLDAGFLLSNRVAEPTGFRLFAMLAVIFFLSKRMDANAKPWQFFWAGMVSSFAFLFFYPTNFFIVPATFILLFALWWLTKKNTSYGFKPWVYYFFSSFLCLAVFLLISHLLIGHLSRFSEILTFSERVAKPEDNGVAGIVKGVGSNIKQITSASFFFFNPYLLVIGLSSLIFFLVSTLKNFYTTKKIGLDGIVWIFLVLFLCQTFFLNDYPRKKMLMLFPFVIYSLIYLLAYIEKKYSQVSLVKFSFLITLPVMLISGFLQFKYIYSQPTYKFKTAMIGLKKYDGRIIAGNLSYAFRLYNRYIPLMDHYTYYRDNVRYHKILRRLIGDKNFAGSIYYAEDKYVKELRDLNLCPADTILADNPNIDQQVTMNKICVP